MDSNDKNNKHNKELSALDEVPLKLRLFNFYYFVLKKKDINMLFCALLLILETIQIISFAFSDPVKKS